VIALQLLAGGLISGFVFHGVWKRPDGAAARAARWASVPLLAAAATAVVGRQIEQPHDVWRGFILPMFALTVVVAVEGLLIARWLRGRKLPLALYLLAYLALLGVAGFITMAVATAVYPGS